MKKASLEWETIVKLILVLAGILFAGVVIYLIREKIIELIGKM